MKKVTKIFIQILFNNIARFYKRIGLSNTFSVGCDYGFFIIKYGYGK